MQSLVSSLAFDKAVNLKHKSTFYLKAFHTTGSQSDENLPNLQLNLNYSLKSFHIFHGEKQCALIGCVSDFISVFRDGGNIVTFDGTYLAAILLNTAVKLLRLRANKTLDAKCFNCDTRGVSAFAFRNCKEIKRSRIINCLVDASTSWDPKSWDLLICQSINLCKF